MSAGRAPKVTAELTGPVEDYLKAIYELERSGEPAETNAIARLLEIAPASVSGMMRRLADRSGHAVDQLVRGCMLEPLRLLVDAVPRIAERTR